MHAPFMPASLCKPCTIHATSHWGAWSGVSSCHAEYRDGSSVFRDKIHSLGLHYSSIRRTRGDGNCAFRAFIFGYMEQLVKTNDLQERNRWAASSSLEH